MEYNVDDAEEKVVYHLNFMKENELWNVDPSRIPNLVNSGLFIVHKEDKYERPLVYMRAQYFLPSDFTYEEMRDYVFWNHMNLRRQFKPHVECHIAIYDVNNVGKKNFNLAMIKKSIPDMGDNLPELCSKIYVVRTGWVLNMLWKTIKPFLHKLTLEKIKFLTDKQVGPEMLQMVAPENLPSIFGGEDKEYEEKYP